jgi:hypothetical protein
VIDAYLWWRLEALEAAYKSGIKHILHYDEKVLAAEIISLLGEAMSGGDKGKKDGG